MNSTRMRLSAGPDIRQYLLGWIGRAIQAIALAGLLAFDAIAALGEDLRELGEAPGRQAVGLRDRGHDRPFFGVVAGQDRVDERIGFETDRGEMRAFASAAPFKPFVITLLVDEMDRACILPLVGLDQVGIVGHARGVRARIQ